jgi:signal transduction histidine kinase/CheY-like chemotaxis protein
VSGSIKALTALASIGTAVLLVSVIPEALALRSPAELEAINETLKNEITERRRAEEEVLKGRELLVQQERMRVVGQLASGIAHDLNNTLNVIKLRVAAMAKDHSLQTLHATAFHAIEREDAVRTVDKVSGARQTAREKQPAFLHTVISQAVELARTSIEERSALRGVPIQIEMELPPNLAPVDGSASDLRQIFLNLLLNAGDAMDKGGKIKIAANSIEYGMVLVTVSDEGTGIRAQDLPHIFEPFYTTKGPRGTGLGLSIASSVMESMYGSINAANRPEGGAIFTLRFRCASHTAAKAEQSTDYVSRRPSRFLLVDDDEDNLLARQELLRSNGHQAEIAKSGREAVDRLRSITYDAILCDLGMPGMDGWEVARQARDIAPGVKFYLVTGWVRQIQLETDHPVEIAGILSKPVDFAEIEKLVADFGDDPDESYC